MKIISARRLLPWSARSFRGLGRCSSYSGQPSFSCRFMLRTQRLRADCSASSSSSPLSSGSFVSPLIEPESRLNPFLQNSRNESSYLNSRFPLVSYHLCQSAHRIRIGKPERKRTDDKPRCKSIGSDPAFLAGKGQQQTKQHHRSIKPEDSSG